ncbi:MAG: S-layer protein, partial [Candidatus Aenigmarchaeota archaeon]|nr:S-layer protein [Candidatus Aenigmarchaeota archaeon]
ANQDNNSLNLLEAVEVKKENSLPNKILSLLAEQPSYPREISRQLKADKQQVYYHIRQLEKKGLIKISHREDIGGTLAKYYRLAAPAFVTVYGQMKPATHIPRSSAGVLSGHIRNGMLDSIVVIGSPDPHGPERARSRDIAYVADLCLFLGTFVSKYEKPKVLFDTNVHLHDLQENIILIGGPITNKVTKDINEKLPVRFDKNRNIYSAVTRRVYKNDYTGFILNIENPFNPKKRLLLLAGKRFYGTHAAVLALMKKFSEIKKQHTIVEGLDEDGDGVIDNVRLLD